jgi:hypothetical protein
MFIISTYLIFESTQRLSMNDRPDLSSEGAPDMDKTVSGNEPHMGLDTKTD